MSSRKVDQSIQQLKGTKPLDNVGISKLYEALKSLSDDLFSTSSILPKLEVPSGNIDGTNAIFILSRFPIYDGFLMVYHNGLLLSNFVLTNKILKLNTAPSVGDVLQVFYFYKG